MVPPQRRGARETRFTPPPFPPPLDGQLVKLDHTWGDMVVNRDGSSWRWGVQACAAQFWAFCGGSRGSLNMPAMSYNRLIKTRRNHSQHNAGGSCLEVGNCSTFLFSPSSHGVGELVVHSTRVGYDGFNRSTDRRWLRTLRYSIIRIVQAINRGHFRSS